MKRCKHCRIAKPLTDFYPQSSGRDRHMAWCKQCHRKRARTYEERAGIKHLYNLSLEEYNQIRAAQGGVCAICKEPSTYGRLHVDHDHACCPGKRSCGNCIRGLLCGRCNRWLGFYEVWATACQDYINRGTRSWQS